MISRVRAKPIAAAFGVVVGLVCAWSAFQSFGSYSGWTVGPLPAVLVLVGSVLLSTMVAISGLTDAVVRRTAYMWGDSIITRTAISFAFAALPAIVWGIAVILLLGVRPGAR